MKYIHILLLMAIATIMTSCPSNSTPDPFYEFVNCTDDSIFIVSGYEWSEEYADLSNDTTIIINKRTGKLSEAMYLLGEHAPMHVWIYYYPENYWDKDNGRNFLHLFIVKIEDVQKYGWKGVVEKNLVLQRYDISYYDMEKVNRRITFPPSPSMVDIRMWPPYGTYSYSLPE